MGSGGIASSWDGTLSESEFRTAASAFADRWRIAESLLPPWSWVPLDEQHRWLSRQVDGFLSLENVCLARSVDDPADGDVTAEESGPCGHDEPVDDATLVQIFGSETDVHHYDFHIIYSHSYRVPVLYFRVYSSDGQPLALSDFKRDLPSDSIEAIVKTKWTFITQEEHPHLKRPWHKLHPCGTSEWVKLLLLSDTSVATRNDAVKLYLLSWFSVVGRVVGLSIPFEIMGSANRDSKFLMDEDHHITFPGVGIMKKFRRLEEDKGIRWERMPSTTRITAATASSTASSQLKSSFNTGTVTVEDIHQPRGGPPHSLLEERR